MGRASALWRILCLIGGPGCSVAAAPSAVSFESAAEESSLPPQQRLPAQPAGDGFIAVGGKLQDRVIGDARQAEALAAAPPAGRASLSSDALRGAYRDAAGYEAGFSKLPHVSECSRWQSPEQSVCVILEFHAGDTDDFWTACRVFEHRQSRRQPPDITEFIDSWADFHQCQPPKNCKMVIDRNVHTDSVYDVFCMAYPLTTNATVFPKCTEHSLTCGVQVSTGGMATHTRFGTTDLVGALMLTAYIVWSFVFEYVHVLHETGFAVLFGLFCGGVQKYFFYRTAQFNYDLFCYFLLPAVIFAAGFNLEKKSFFRYSGYIISLGVTGTVLIFIFIYYLSSLARFKNQAGVEIQLLPHHRLIMASVLSSTDSVAPMAFLPSASFPCLYAVVFGEGVLNDVVSILLSISAQTGDELPNAFVLFGNLGYFFVTSSALGIAFGLLVSYLFRRVTILREEKLKSTALLLLSNYSCYVLAEILDVSSIFALFMCSLLTGHYARHSLSLEAGKFLSELAEFMSYMAEAFIFGYFGLTAWNYVDDEEIFSISLILFFTACIVVARSLAVMLVALALRVVKCGEPLALSPREWCVVAFAGSMRGTIAYALILRATPAEEHRNATEAILISTVLGIVLMNCLVFGGLFPVFLKCAGIEAHGGGPILDSFPHGQAPQTMRRGLHRFWHYVDRHWLRPTFRADSEPALSMSTIRNGVDSSVARAEAFTCVSSTASTDVPPEAVSAAQPGRAGACLQSVHEDS